MASEEMRSFIEDRLRALDPSIDLNSGSPAQVTVVQPIIDKLGTDPFETDIEKFILDRMSQEFPDIYASDPSVLNDVFVKPLIMLLEPIKREIQTVKINQSFANSELLSDDDADLLTANFFHERSTGGLSSGIARVYFVNPLNVQIEVSTRFFTASGLNFFPTETIGITAEEMIFNKEGNLFYADISVQAEEIGDSYNIEAGLITGVDGIFGALKATNKIAFIGGSNRLSSSDLISTTRESLSERSMVTRRGSVARIMDIFSGSVKALQVIGANDEEMQRDILVALSPGHAWITGRVSLYENIAYVRARTIDDSIATPTVSVGDTLYLYLDKYSYSGTWLFLDQTSRFIRLTVEEIILGPLEDTSGYQAAYLLRWSGTIPDGVTLPTVTEVEGGLAKVGSVAITSVPGAKNINKTVANQDVHVYGHTDIYVRPVSDELENLNLTGVQNDSTKAAFNIQSKLLETFGAGPDLNKVTDATIDFEQSGVTAGDTIKIDTGADAGFYRIVKVDANDLYLDTDLSASTTNIKYSIFKDVSVNFFEPKNVRIPFGDVIRNDLYTVLGSNVFTLSDPSSDVVTNGAVVGDTIRLIDGPDAGDFIITALDVGGKIITVDRAAENSFSGITYEIFETLEVPEVPLVRIKEISILDSSSQKIGISIPPAEPIGVIPTCDLSSATIKGHSQRKSGFVLPALKDSIGGDDYVFDSNEAAPSGDNRYSSGLDSFTGNYKWVQFVTGDNAEFVFPLDADSGCSYFLATSEDTSSSENFPPVDPKPGEVLTVKSGPNKGSYAIKSVTKFKHKITGPKTMWAYFIKIHGTFPVDIFRSIISFLDSLSISTTDIKITAATTYPISYPGYFETAYASLGQKIHDALTVSGTSSPGAVAIQAIVESIVEADYEWGSPAKGVLRTYFERPVLFEQNTDDNENPTTYRYTNSLGGVTEFRPDLDRYQKYSIVPPKVDSEIEPLEYPRDYQQTGTSFFLTDTSRNNLLKTGVKIGDTLEVFPEVLMHGSTGPYGEDRQTAVQTSTNSNRIVAPSTSSGALFTEDMVGNYLFIDNGDDEGGYLVTKFISSNTLALDRALKASTPTIILQGNAASWGFLAGNNQLVASASVFSPSNANKYLTLYGIDSTYQGSYKIDSLSPFGTTVYLVRPPSASPLNFPAYPVNAIGRWVVTDGPVSGDPIATTAGTELHGVRSIRMYNDVSITQTITDIPTDLSLIEGTGSVTRDSGTSELFRIYRENIRRITPSEMKLNREGPYYYFDTEVMSLGATESSNVREGAYLTIKDGSYKSFGFKHVVDDYTLSYSSQETGYIVLPTKILPEDVEDSEDSLIDVVGSSIQIDYARSATVSQVQDFVDSTSERVTTANMLVRHFLPSYASFHGTYVGGSSVTVIGDEIKTYLDNIPIDTEIDVSEIAKRIDDRGGNPETPLTVYTLTHDWDRKMWLGKDQNKIGGLSTDVPINGSARVLYIISGDNASTEAEAPIGESIFLTRL